MKMTKKNVLIRNPRQFIVLYFTYNLLYCRKTKMSSRKVENLSQIVNAIHPGPKEPGFLAVISVKKQILDIG